MTALESMKAALKGPFLWALDAPQIRRRILFELTQKHYADLDIRVPLGHGLQCPISHPEHWSSFSEIFLGGEYERAWDAMPLPTRWLDLGCYAGYFSLYVAWLRARANLHDNVMALLIDADVRARSAVEKLMSMNRLGDKFRFAHGAISRFPWEIGFAQRPFMASSVLPPGGHGNHDPVRTVPVISAREITQQLAPPYDLTKVDIEGSEYDFLTAYREVLAETRYLLLEWHSGHDGGGGMESIKDRAKTAHFSWLAEVVPAHSVEYPGGPGTCGVLLFENCRSFIEATR